MWADSLSLSRTLTLKHHMDRRSIESLYDNGYVVLKGIVPDDVWVPARRQLILKLGELHAGAMGSGGQGASAAACPCWQSARHGTSICTFFSLSQRTLH
jgi:hypothetical protein